MHIVSWDNAVNRDRAELIFNNRNQEYGAYVIRRDYEKILIYALLYTLAGIALIVAIPVIIGLMSDRTTIKEKVLDEGLVISHPSFPQKEIIIPKTISPPPPVAKIIEFTPPRIVKNVESKELPPVIDQINNDQVGTKNIEGQLQGRPDLPVENSSVINDDATYIWVPEMPQFPGGDEALFKYLATQIKYPVVDVQNHIEGVVYISFVVDKEGKVKDAKVLRSVSTRCDEEALRVVKSMPQWRPGKQNGSPVSVIFNVPVRFSLK